MTFFRNIFPLALLAVLFYLPGTLAIPSSLISYLLTQLPGAAERSSCGCLDPHCGCQAPCCAPKNQDHDSGGGSCCSGKKPSAQTVWKAVCTCGTNHESTFISLSKHVLDHGETRVLFIPWSRAVSPHLDLPRTNHHPSPPDKIPIHLLFS